MSYEYIYKYVSTINVRRQVRVNECMWSCVRTVRNKFTLHLHCMCVCACIIQVPVTHAFRLESRSFVLLSVLSLLQLHALEQMTTNRDLNYFGPLCHARLSVSDSGGI